MPVTAKDVARELNLSQPTVSRILNGDSGHRASDETRRRVIEAAQRLGYQPNGLARSLRRGRTNIIGVHIGSHFDVRNDFLGTIVGALQAECAPRELDIMLHAAAQGDSAQGMFGKLRDGRIDGLVLHTCPTDPLVDLLCNSSLPVVAVADPLPGLPAVGTDDRMGMRLLIDELWQRGYRKFAFISPHFWLASVQRRQDAFIEELQRREILTQDFQIVSVRSEDTAPVLPELMRMRTPGKPLAICCWNDRTAYDLMRVCATNGIGVPAKFGVTGFDGFLDEKLPARKLMTVGCPWEAVASTALRLLVEMIESGNAQNGIDNNEILLPPSLMDGDTI